MRRQAKAARRVAGVRAPVQAQGWAATVRRRRVPERAAHAAVRQARARAAVHADQVLAAVAGRVATRPSLAARQRMNRHWHLPVRRAPAGAVADPARQGSFYEQNARVT